MRTREELADRLRELKSSRVPRCSLERVDALPPNQEGAPKWTDSVPAELHAALDVYLRHYAWLEGPPREDGWPAVLCPGCETRGWFGWGVVHGSGKCNCGWPGTLYHVLHDDRPEAECETCHLPRSQHVETKREWRVVGVEESVRRVEVTCPTGDSLNPWFRPPVVLKFDVLLWAHPYEVHLPKEQR